MGRKGDYFWRYVGTSNGNKCIFCGHPIPGAHRNKYHLAQVPGRGIRICDKVPEDVRDAARRALNSSNERVEQSRTGKNNIGSSLSRDSTRGAGVLICDKVPDNIKSAAILALNSSNERVKRPRSIATDLNENDIDSSLSRGSTRDVPPLLPRARDYQPTLEPNTQVPINMRIADLWFPCTKAWNEEMLRSIFIEEDADHIIQLKVPAYGEDELRWIIESSGEFTMNSVYYACNRHCYSERDAQRWQKLWQTVVHYRLKVTYWRFARGIIPTRVRIQNYANLQNVLCPLCELEPEDELHIMARCEVTKLLWFQVLGIHIHEISIPNPLNFLESILQMDDHIIPRSAPQEFANKVKAGAAIIIRRVWEARNDMIFERKRSSSESLAIHVENDLRLELWRMQGNAVTPTLGIPTSWMPPPMECLKLNVDTVWKDGYAALAVLGRDDIAHVEDFWFEKIQCGSLEEAKANAILKACKVAGDLCFPKIIIESDCKLVVDVVLDFINCPGKLHALVEDIRYYLHVSTVLSLVWIGREANSVAHEGAKWVFNVIGSGAGSICEIPLSVQMACNHDLKIGSD